MSRPGALAGCVSCVRRARTSTTRVGIDRCGRVKSVQCAGHRKVGVRLGRPGDRTARQLCVKVALGANEALEERERRESEESYSPAMKEQPRPRAAESTSHMDDGNEFRGSGFIGATALIAGGCVGGGILALPQATSSVGFIPVCVAAFGVWGFLFIQGLLLVEVNQAVCSRGGRDSSSILSMGKETLGQPLGRAMACAYFLYANFVLVGQFSKGGSLLVLEGFHDSVESLSYGSLHYTITVLTLVGFVGIVVYLGGGDLAERTNRWLTLLLLTTFGFLVGIATKEAHWSNLLIADWAQLPTAVSTLFQVLCFGGVIPVACACVDRSDVRTMRNAVFWGSFVPLLMVITWNGIAIALAPPPGTIIEEPGAEALKDPINLLLSTHETGPLAVLVSTFSFSAVLTTVIGLLLALTEFVEESLEAACEEHEKSCQQAEQDVEGAKSLGGRETRWVMAAVVTVAGLESRQASPGARKPLSKADRKRRLKRAARYITIVPSAVMASMGPSMFYEAIHINGSYVVPFLFCVAPPLMALAARDGYRPDGLRSESLVAKNGDGVDSGRSDFRPDVPSLVPGGSKALWAMFGLGSLVIVAQLLVDVPDLF